MSDFDQNPAPSAAPSDNGAPSPSPAIADPSAAPGATPQAPAAAPIQQSQPEPSWLRGRLQETRDAAIRQANERWQTERQQMQAQFEATQRQLHAIIGVTPQGDPEVQAIKSQFEKLYPGLSKLEQRAQDLESLVERSGDFQQQNQHYWTSYGRQQMDRLFEHASKSLGSPLTDEGRRALHAAFSGYVQSSPTLVQRYGEDPSMVDEFWQNFSGAFIDPARRSAAATVEQQTQHRAFPQDTPGGAPQMSPAPRPGSADDRMAGAWTTYSQAAIRRP